MSEHDIKEIIKEIEALPDDSLVKQQANEMSKAELMKFIKEVLGRADIFTQQPIAVYYGCSIIGAEDPGPATTTWVSTPEEDE